MFTIKDFQVKNLNRGILTPDRVKAAIAHISSNDGDTMFLSRYEDEKYWVIDTLILSGSSMPVFSNGEGARVTLLRTLREDTDVATTLNKKFSEALN